MEAFTLTAADTGERLRTKHIRTLEAMQKLVSDNYALREQLDGMVRPKIGDDSEAQRLRVEIDTQRLQFEREIANINAKWSAEVIKLSSDCDRLRLSCARLQDALDHETKQNQRAREARVTVDVSIATDPAPTPSYRSQECQIELDCPDCVRLRQSLSESKAKMEVLLKQAEEAKVAGVDVCSSGADTSFREECRRLSDENLRLKREHCDSLADNQRLKQVVSALEGELAAAASSNEQSKRVIQGLQSDAGLAAHTIRRLEDALHAVTAQLTATQGEVEELKVKLQQTREKSGRHVEPPGGATPFAVHVTLTKENAMLRDQIASLKAERRQRAHDGAEATLHPPLTTSGSFQRMSSEGVGPLGPIVKPHGIAVLRKGSFRASPSISLQ